MGYAPNAEGAGQPPKSRVAGGYVGAPNNRCTAPHLKLAVGDTATAWHMFDKTGRESGAQYLSG